MERLANIGTAQPPPFSPGSQRALDQEAGNNSRTPPENNNKRAATMELRIAAVTPASRSLRHLPASSSSSSSAIV